MLQPRESDIPLLFLVLVVLPLVTYVLLGIWNEAAKKKARISMLADLAAEEAFSVEATTPTNYVPPGGSSKTTSHVCARCFAPATTRCARCKSIRYCSGKCQIIHWRQGHREECHHWQESSLNLSVVSTSLTKSVEPRHSVNEKLALQMLGDDMKELRYSNVSSDLLDDPYVTGAATSSDIMVGTSKVSTSERKLSDKWVPNALERDMCSYDNVASSSEESISPNAATPTLHSTTLFTEVSSKNIPSKHKTGMENFIVSGKENFSASDGPHRRLDRTPIFAKTPAILKNIMHLSHKSTDKVRSVSRPSSSPDIVSSMTVDRNVINDYKCGMDLSSEKVDFQNGKVSSAGETSELSTAAERNLGNGRINYKKPPYTLDAAISLSTKLVDKVMGESSLPDNERDTNIENESTFSHRSVSTNIPIQSCNGLSDMGELKMASPRMSPKVPRQNLVGFINNHKKNKVLFPYEDLVKLFQCESWHISPRGLLNCGNSCYANAVLQCLTCTKPLMIYLLQRQHSRACWVRDWCLMCELEQHVSILRDGMGSLSPNRILSNMRHIGWRMGDGNQEDAHEFLRLLVMSMQSICLEGLGGEKKVDQVLQETTLIQQIFGGRLRSKVKCMRCHHESERYENIMDLTLEIHGCVESLQDALTQFTAPEDLDGENMYRCGRCSAYVKARKQLSVHEVPNILTVVLKRFQSGQYGKINKCVTFPDMLDMIPFMTGTADNPPLYLLYAVVVHLDTLNASFSGHYVSYVKDLQGTWFRMDDSEVQPVPLSQVMSEGAYMLFYSRPFPRPPRTYLEKSPIPSLRPSNHITSKTLKSSRYGKDKQDSPMFASEFSLDVGNASKPEYSVGNEEYIQRSASRTINPRGGTYGDSFNMEFSDATSSDWSLFTSSDESSFTTESTRDSFSTVDHGDGAGLDSIAAIFSPIYGPDYSRSNTIYHTKFSPCKSERRFFPENKGFVLDTLMPIQQPGCVHKGRNP